MSLKNWMVGRMNRLFTRADLAPRDARPTLGDASAGAHDATARGRYARTAAPDTRRARASRRLRPLVAAIREELERFVATDLRLHLAIAEHDRYVLTAIAIDSVGPTKRANFCALRREFAPEQVKHFLAKEIIGRLPNASAIDLTQFAGLDAAARRRGRRHKPTRNSWPNRAATRAAAAVPSPARGPLVGPGRAGRRPPRQGGPAPPCRHRSRDGGRRRGRGAGGVAASCCRPSSRPPIRRRQGRRLRHRGRGPVRQSPALRAVARPRRVVGNRLRIDQRIRVEPAGSVHGRSDANAAARATQGTRGHARRVHRAVGIARGDRADTRGWCCAGPEHVCARRWRRRRQRTTPHADRRSRRHRADLRDRANGVGRKQVVDLPRAATVSRRALAHAEAGDRLDAQERIRPPRDILEPDAAAPPSCTATTVSASKASSTRGHAVRWQVGQTMGSDAPNDEPECTLMLSRAHQTMNVVRRASPPAGAQRARRPRATCPRDGEIARRGRTRSPRRPRAAGIIASTRTAIAARPDIGPCMLWRTAWAEARWPRGRAASAPPRCRGARGAEPGADTIAKAMLDADHEMQEHRTSHDCVRRGDRRAVRRPDALSRWFVAWVGDCRAYPSAARH